MPDFRTFGAPPGRTDVVSCGIFTVDDGEVADGEVLRYFGGVHRTRAGGLGVDHGEKYGKGRPRSYVYRRAGLPCRICSTPIAHAVLEGRNLFWCPTCQPE